jgi:predicted dehydrogenase
MRIAIIGDHNHAARIRGLAAEHPAISEIVVYHPENTRIQDLEMASNKTTITPTSDFDDVLECEGVLICSPSNTHRDYLQRLHAYDQIRIFCEKPISTTADDLNWLRSLPPRAKKNIYCNQNYAHTEFCRSAEALIANEKLGLPRHLQFCATHGLAFNSSFADNWRFRSLDPFASIVGNLGIHYAHLTLRLFGEPDRVVCHRSRGNPDSTDADTCSILMQCQENRSVYVHLSYAAPFTNTAQLMFTDGILHLDDGCLRLYAPRDSFDDDGRYTKPPHKEICSFGSSKAYYDQSLARSLDDFFDGVVSGRAFSEDAFGMAVKSAELVLRMCADNDDL